MEKNERRKLGAHLTSIDIFKEYILPKIKDKLNNYVWVDLYCGEGNLILPILECIEKERRVEFFKENIFLFDIQPEMVKKAIENAVHYGIPKKIAERNITMKDTLEEFPKFLKNLSKPVYHITNPPYLYLGYIAKHNREHLKYFRQENKGLQDLYQIALISDLRNSLERMVYIIPSNFLFGHSVSNKIRDEFLSSYKINEAVVFEKKIFEFTGTNVVVCFFEKSENQKKIEFEATKINAVIKKRKYVLLKENHFRAGSEFDDYVKKNKTANPFEVTYYLTEKELNENKGKNKLSLLDSKEYLNGEYTKKTFFVNNELNKKIKENPLFIRTVDTGSEDGRAGLYNIKETFQTDGVFVKGATYRTNPIQILIRPGLTQEKSELLKKKFNETLEKLREKTDSEFMTTYKYTNGTGKYVRKYLGLSQAKKIVQTIQL